MSQVSTHTAHCVQAGIKRSTTYSSLERRSLAVLTMMKGSPPSLSSTGSPVFVGTAHGPMKGSQRGTHTAPPGQRRGGARPRDRRQEGAQAQDRREGTFTLRPGRALLKSTHMSISTPFDRLNYSYKLQSSIWIGKSRVNRRSQQFFQTERSSGGALDGPPYT